MLSMVVFMIVFIIQKVVVAVMGIIAVGNNRNNGNGNCYRSSDNSESTNSSIT